MASILVNEKYYLRGGTCTHAPSVYAPENLTAYPAALPVDPDSQVSVDQFGERSDDNRNKVRVAVEHDFLADGCRHGE